VTYSKRKHGACLSSAWTAWHQHAHYRRCLRWGSLTCIAAVKVCAVHNLTSYIVINGRPLNACCLHDCIMHRMCRSTATGAIARLRNRHLFLALHQWKLYAADRLQKQHLQQVASDWHLDCRKKRSLIVWLQLVQVTSTVHVTVHQMQNPLS
jgi:hypothetical protein